jgi:transcription-repair coupling factor (superfamily II helicase)
VKLTESLDRFSRSAKFEELRARIERGESLLFATNLYGSSRTLAAALLFERIGRTLLFVAGTEEEARGIAEDMRALLGEEKVVTLPPLSLRRLDEELPHMDIAAQRMEALSSLLAGRNTVVVAPALSAMQMLIHPARLSGLMVEVSAGDLLEMDDFLRRMEELGYVQEDLVFEVGTIARRGGIVDLYGFRMRNPVRLEFDENRLVSIREFDPQTQRSTAPLDRARIVPVEERKNGPLECSIFEYLPRSALIVADEYDELADHAEQLFRRHEEEQHLLAPADLMSRMGGFQTLGLSLLHLVPRRSEESAVRFDTREPVPVNRKFSNFLEALAGHRREGYHVILLCDNEGQEERFRDMLGEREGEVELLRGSLQQGFLAPDVLLAVYTDHEIFSRPRRIRYVREYRGAAPVESFSSIKPGDYLVHMNYGIGRYEGLSRIETGDGEIECLALSYQDGDRVYVPVDRLSLVEKYSTEDVAPPALDRIGSKRWEKLKKKTKESIKEMAKELLELYAARKVVKGFSYPADTPWQMELESSFLYEDTPDQSRATEDVKRDMEAPIPMDRLVCGDVGYGKTEVAIRAAFKALQDGKQVGVLVPTTVLAQQHLFTFRSRLEMFPVKIEMLSRFLSSKEQKAVIAGVRDGAVDIVIGTHRLLSKDVVFKDLGLLIIDEEHRFGVRQKEKLKALRRNIDVLSLSATPIPRTLSLSLMGLRDMSVIETPPRDRMPIATYVTPWNEDLIREAVMREVDRGGQVFFIHNRIASIDPVKKMLERRFPDLAIAVAHGQMHERALERVMLLFLKGEIDVLLCTMIVESGLDIPNANTLIVNRADTLGLAQLYQLRGRVGRSNRKASAYLLVPPRHYLDSRARRRLRVLEEYTDLGSGYWVALKDLELRGAGTILGAEQHGFVRTMGFETYSRILEDSIRELKGEVKEEKEPVELRSDIEAYLPDDYAGSEDQKLSLYRKLSRVESLGELERLREEILDRFGPLPSPAWNLLALVEVRILAEDLGIQSVSVKRESAAIIFKEGFPLRMDAWNLALAKNDSGISASWDRKNRFTFWPLGSRNLLKNLIRLLREVPR